VLLLVAVGAIAACSGGRDRPGTDSIPPESLDRAIALFNRGIGLLDAGKPTEAANTFDEAVRLAPGWTTARIDLAIALLNSEVQAKLVRAESELRRVIASDRASPYAHYTLGMLLRHLTRFDEARAEFERVLEIDPDDGDTHYQLGILIADSDPAAAIRHLEKTIEKIPHHEAACYRLQSLLRQAGKSDRARELLSRFEALKSSGAGVRSGMKYGEMGRYAEPIRRIEAPASPQLPGSVPRYTERAADAGLTVAAGGTAGWPGESKHAGAAAFGPGVAAADVDGDGDLDLYIPGGGGDSRGVLYLNEGGRFTVVPDSGIDGRNAIGAFFGDYDGDGDPDLFLSCDGPNRLYRNEGGGRFADVTRKGGIAGGPYVSVGAAWADADQDGDLDLYVANVSRSDRGEERGNAPNNLWRNNGDGTFTDIAKTAGIDCADAASTGVAFFDADDDRDLDLFVMNRGSRNRLFLNDRVGRYTDATDRYPGLADAGPGLGAVLGDVNGDGEQDLLLLEGEESPRLFLRTGRERFEEDPAFRDAARATGGAVGGLLGDLDLDGDLDLVLLATGGPNGTADRIFMNRGGGRFDPPVLLGAERSGAPQARGALAADLDGDGMLDLLVARAGATPELWRAPPPPNRHWLEVIPVKGGAERALGGEPAAVGLAIEVKTGRRLQTAAIASSSGYLGGVPSRAHFGLGSETRADYIRLTWPDAALQSELEVPADQRWQITKAARKASSCPVLFAWGGSRFQFITDFLGVGGLGFFVAPGTYAPPDPTEDVRVPPQLVAPRGGRYEFRIAEPLEEATYLDEVHLIAYDHPSGWEVHPDERFPGAPPLPTGRPFAVERKVFPAAARTDRGDAVLDEILEIDRRYVEPPVDPRFPGYASDHWLELDFGERLRSVPPGARLVLYLYGWVEYTYSHVNYAAYQAGLSLHPPSIEVPGADGGWNVAIEDAGFPAGLPRMMTLDITSLPIREDGRIRIRTNMQIYWDQIFAGVDVAGRGVRAHDLRPAAAVLRSLGYPREYSPDGADPTIYDYARIDRGLPFKNLTGDFTRFGDVRPLLHAADDLLVVMGRGEEIALEFDAEALPPLPAGWTRTLVLHTEGYCKDMDLYTAFPDTVLPLPYRAMKNYPPDAAAPTDQRREQYERAWNSRRQTGR